MGKGCCDTTPVHPMVEEPRFSECVGMYGLLPMESPNLPVMARIASLIVIPSIPRINTYIYGHLVWWYNFRTLHGCGATLVRMARNAAFYACPQPYCASNGHDDNPDCIFKYTTHL